MRIAGQIREHGLWPGEGLFGIDDPVDFTQRFKEGAESFRPGKVRMIAEETQLPSIVQPDQPFQNKTSVQTGQNTHGQEEILAAVDPLCPICRQAAARYDHVHVWVMGHRRSPGMEYRRDANPGVEVLWVMGNLDHRVRADAHQQIVDLPFVLIRDVSNGFGQREDEVEIPHRQQLGLACRQPGFGCPGLTFGAVPVATGVIGNVLMSAVFAARNVTAKLGCATALNCAHYLQLG